MNELEIGSKISKIRKAKKLSLQEVADGADLSKSFVSQVELSTCKPSIGSLKRIADVLGVTLGSLFNDDEELNQQSAVSHSEGKDGPSAISDEVEIVRKKDRKRLQWPGMEADAELLTPNMRRKLEVLLTTYSPGDEDHSGTQYQHQGEEFGIVLKGKFEVIINDKSYILEEGDSIYFSSSLPHTTRAIGEKEVTTLWVITPPSF